MNKLSDNMLLVNVAATATLNGSASTSAGVDLTEFDKCCFVIDTKGAVGAPRLNLDVECASDASFIDAESIKAVVGIVADADPKIGVDVKAEDLVEDKPWVRVVVTETAATGIDVTVSAGAFSPHHAYENKLGADLLYNTWE